MEIVVALILAIPALIAALASWRQAKKGAREATEMHSSFKGNGHGDVTAMVTELREYVLDLREFRIVHERKHQKLEERMRDN